MARNFEQFLLRSEDRHCFWLQRILL